MNAIQKITAAALRKGLEVRMEGQELIGVDRLGEGRVVLSATIAVGGRYLGGYTTDTLGHVVHHHTLRAFVAAI